MLTDRRIRIDLLWMAIALSALVVATLVYFLDRPPGVYFIPDGLNPFPAPVGLFGNLGYSLPSFVHVFSMILITGGVLSSRGFQCILICLGWLLVEVVFELGQADALGRHFAGFFADWLGPGFLLQAQQAYFINGTFDGYDILAAALGAVAAYAVMRFSQQTQ